MRGKRIITVCEWLCAARTGRAWCFPGSKPHPPQTKFLSCDAPKSTHGVAMLQAHCLDAHRERPATCFP